MHPCIRISVKVLLLLASLGAAADDSYARTDPVVPFDNRVTYARVELGKRLFFDPRLSGSSAVSCATCHNPALGWSDGLRTSSRPAKGKPPRRTPSLLNAAYNKRQMWDGRFVSLEEQVLNSADDMDLDVPAMVKRLQSIKGYEAMFELAYPGDGITETTVAKAIASFERTLVSRRAAFDRWQDGEEDAMSDAAKRGFRLFRGKAGCAACHEGPTFSDGAFHNVGVKPLPGVEDVGRFTTLPVKAMKGAHKTPSLRDVAYKTPYMHNGAYGTLREVVEMYSRGGDAREGLDHRIRKLDLSPGEVGDIVAFLESLTGDPVLVAAPQLPY